MSGALEVEKPLRIGTIAELTGTTPRTIRYYEEIGLLPAAGERQLGQHRCYTQADVDLVRDILRLRDLLGLSLEQLSELLAARDPQTEIGIRLDLVRNRRRELEQLERELVGKRRTLHKRLGEEGR